MSHKSRTGVFIGMAAAGAFGAAAMMSAATAPTARADDFSDIIAAVEGDYTNGSTAFTTAETDFGSNELAPGLAAFFDGVDDESLSAPDNLLVGTVEALTNETITPSISWDYGVPTSFSDALSEEQLIVTSGEGFLADASTALSSGDYGSAAYYDLIGSQDLLVGPLQELLLGVAASF
jgi:hypothetical protein